MTSIQNTKNRVGFAISLTRRLPCHVLYFGAWTETSKSIMSARHKHTFAVRRNSPRQASGKISHVCIAQIRSTEQPPAETDRPKFMFPFTTAGKLIMSPTKAFHQRYPQSSTPSPATTLPIQKVAMHYIQLLALRLVTYVALKNTQLCFQRVSCSLYHTMVYSDFL